MRKNNSCCPVTLEWFSIHLCDSSEIFKLSLNISPSNLRAQSACYELKGDLSPVMLKEIFHDSLKISKFTMIDMENHSRVLQSLLLRYTAENVQVTKFQYALSVPANKMFQMRTVFAFIEKSSRDQLMQKANCIVLQFEYNIAFSILGIYYCIEICIFCHCALLGLIRPSTGLLTHYLSQADEEVGGVTTPNQYQILTMSFSVSRKLIKYFMSGFWWGGVGLCNCQTTVWLN